MENRWRSEGGRAGWGWGAVLWDMRFATFGCGVSVPTVTLRLSGFTDF